MRHVQNGIPRTALKSRKLEIEERLAACGLARGPRRLLHGAGVTAYETSYGCRLRTALESLGPVFSSFGLYMSSRIDLLPVKDCLELAAIADKRDATPPPTVRTLFKRETGRSPEEADLTFQEEPFESRLFYQSHAAWLKDGTAVVVKLIHPEAEEQILCDVELLSLLSDALVVGGMTDPIIKGVIVDFRHTLRQQVDFIPETKALRVLAQDAEEFDLLRAPAVREDFSGAKVLTIEQLAGSSLESVISFFSEAGERTGGSARYGGVNRSELARLLSTVWLWQALLGHTFPVEPRPENITLLPDKRIAFTGGVFASLPSEPQANLRDYLIAVSTENPDRACSCLLREIRKEGAAVGDDGLRRQFRQIVPFHDGVWRNSGDSTDLSAYLFAHWRLASECGYVPQAHLPAFFRGLFTVTEIARRLAPDYAPLTEGLHDVRLMASLAELRGLIGLRQLGEQMDKYAMMMTELPQRLDEVLTLASGGNAQVKVHISEPADQRRQKNRSAAVTALLLVLAAVALLSHHFTAGATAGLWADRLSTIVFLGVSALLLRVASQSH
jgi:ubiquinone biosynthesis protein